jgi:hypothetical protein
MLPPGGRAQQVVLVLVLCEHHNTSCRHLLPQHQRCLESIHPRHADVHDDDVWQKLESSLDRLEAVSRFAEDANVLFREEE